jgi:hypothetical protein
VDTRGGAPTWTSFFIVWRDRVVCRRPAVDPFALEPGYPYDNPGESGAQRFFGESRTLLDRGRHEAAVGLLGHVVRMWCPRIALLE